MASFTFNHTVVKGSLSQKTDKELIDILSIRQDDYDREAIPLVEEALIERGFNEDDIAGYKYNYEALISKINNQPTQFIAAGFWIRVCQYIIDHFICYGGAYVIGIVGGYTKADEGSYYGMAIIVYIIYYTVFFGIFKATIGMMITGLTAIGANDRKPISLYQSFLRGVWMVFNFLLLQLGNLAMIFDKNKRTLTDRFTNTLIVYKNS
jgi:uncharacterized RDD family membrane protein YckC